MSLLDWYPLALSRDIAAGTSAGTRVNSNEFVVWRDNKGKAHVWEDRCPHRGMKMSFGFVRGDHIACLYHGWEYDTEGQCQYVPAHPKLEVPKTIKIPRFAITEAGGVIWGCFNEVDGDLPPAPELEEAVTPLKSVFADCPAALAIAAFPGTLYGDTSPAVTKTTDRILEMALGDLTVIAAVQSVSDVECALHLVVQGEATPAQLKALSLWADQLRLNLETAAQEAALSEAAA